MGGWCRGVVDRRLKGGDGRGSRNWGDPSFGGGGGGV